jgi:hypothetical protein
MVAKRRCRVLDCEEKPVLRMTIEGIDGDAAILTGFGTELEKYRVYACGPHAHAVFNQEAMHTNYVDKRPYKRRKKVGKSNKHQLD